MNVKRNRKFGYSYKIVDGRLMEKAVSQVITNTSATV